MQIEEAKEYIKMIIRKQEIPDSAKALGYVYAAEAIETVLNELKEQTEANKELNKVLIHFKAVINEMAKMINNHDIDEDICKQMGKKKDCNDYADEENCIDCIKEYFYKKTQKQ